jgi:hypothetical protein
MRLRLDIRPMARGSQVRVQSWTGTHWETHGKLHQSNADTRELVDAMQAGCRLRGIPCEIIRPHQRENAA